MSARLDGGRLAVVVHEIRSSVAALSSIAEHVSRTPPEGTEGLELVRLSIAACRGIERVVGDVTIASVRLERLDVGQLAHDVVAAARLVGGAVRAEIEPDLPVVDGDRDRLRQALDNLLTNARAHAPAGTEVVVRVAAREDRVVVSVEDRGVGIAPEDQERIFERGVRLDTARPGSGLGLAVARAIAEAHEGRLTVESTPGKGSTFALALPARR